MMHLELRNGENSYVFARLKLILGKKPDSFFYIFHQVIEGFSLCKDVNPDSTGASMLSIVVNLKLNKHPYYVLNFNYIYQASHWFTGDQG